MRATSARQGNLGWDQRFQEVSWNPNKDGGPIVPAQRAWSEPDLEAIDTIVREGLGVGDIIEKSPIRFEEVESHAEDIIDILFPGNPLLCCGKTDYLFATAWREVRRKRGLDTMSLVVPRKCSTPRNPVN